jgi:hypothetical protein
VQGPHEPETQTLGAVHCEVAVQGLHIDAMQASPFEHWLLPVQAGPPQTPVAHA